jgi:hypothetical protein
MVLKKISSVLLFLLAVLFVFLLSGVRSVDAGRGDSTGDPQTGDSTATPASGDISSNPDDNLLANPDFSGGFSGWSSVNGHWLVHPTQCDASIWPQEMAEMDQDQTKSGAARGWLVGQEDWLWQDVAVPVEHSELLFTIYESHHMSTGIAQTHLYGSDDGVTWTEVWNRPAPEALAYGAGKKCEPVPGFTYTIPVSHSYSYYRLEFHGKMVDEFDGWIFSWLSLEAVPSAATATIEATATQVPSSPTPTSTPTSQMDKPGGVDPSTGTPVASSTATPTPTFTLAPTFTPTPTDTSTSTATPTAEATVCTVCQDPDTPTPEATPTSGRGNKATATPGPTPTAKGRGS